MASEQQNQAQQDCPKTSRRAMMILYQPLGRRRSFFKIKHTTTLKKLMDAVPGRQQAASAVGHTCRAGDGGWQRYHVMWAAWYYCLNIYSH